MYLAPRNISRAISVLTLGNKVMLYSIVLYCFSIVFHVGTWNETGDPVRSNKRFQQVPVPECMLHINKN